MIINLENLQTLFETYNASFQGAFTSVEGFWQRLTLTVPSNTKQNIYAWLGQFPKMREWIGDRHIKNLEMNDYTVVNKTYESTVAVPRETIEDDQYGAMSSIFAEMGNTAGVHPDEVVFGLLALGASELCYDGQFYFDTDHPILVSGAASTATNYDSVGGGNLWMLMDTTRPLKPMIFQRRRDYRFQTYTQVSDQNVFMHNEFLYGIDARVNAGFGIWQTAYGSLNTVDATNFEAYRTAMRSRRSDEDRPLGISPNLLVCGPSNEVAARNLILTERLANGATNPNYQAVELHISPYLT